MSNVGGGTLAAGISQLGKLIQDSYEKQEERRNSNAQQFLKQLHETELQKEKLDQEAAQKQLDRENTLQGQQSTSAVYQEKLAKTGEIYDKVSTGIDKYGAFGNIDRLPELMAELDQADAQAVNEFEQYKANRLPDDIEEVSSSDAGARGQGTTIRTEHDQIMLDLRAAQQAAQEKIEKNKISRSLLKQGAGMWSVTESEGIKTVSLDKSLFGSMAKAIDPEITPYEIDMKYKAELEAVNARNAANKGVMDSKTSKAIGVANNQTSIIVGRGHDEAMVTSSGLQLTKTQSQIDADRDAAVAKALADQEAKNKELLGKREEQGSVNTALTMPKVQDRLKKNQQVLGLKTEDPEFIKFAGKYFTERKIPISVDMALSRVATALNAPEEELNKPGALRSRDVVPGSDALAEAATAYDDYLKSQGAGDGKRNGQGRGSSGSKVDADAANDLVEPYLGQRPFNAQRTFTDVQEQDELDLMNIERENANQGGLADSLKRLSLLEEK